MLCSYHIYIFVVECMGITAVLPYALLQVISTRPTGSKGLPPDDGISIGEKIFNINVLVPCYSESLEVGPGPMPASDVDAVLMPLRVALMVAMLCAPLYYVSMWQDHQMQMLADVAALHRC